jgi:hypothetical protein
MARKTGMQVLKFLMTWNLPWVLLVLAWASLPMFSTNATTSRSDAWSHHALITRSGGHRCMRT